MSYTVNVSLDVFHAHIAADIGKTSLSGYEWWAAVGLPSWAGAAYCAAGLEAALVELGAGKLPAEAPYYCPSLEKFARSKGIWVTPATTRARRGDWVLFDWGGGDGIADHVGFVERDNGDGTITTIEYNTSSDNAGSQSDGRGVWRRTRYLTSVRGYIRLSYGSGTSEAPVAAPTPVSTATLAVGRTNDVLRVKALQASLNKVFPGYVNVPMTVDGIYGRKTAAAVAEFQKAARIGVDGRFGPATRDAYKRITGYLI